MKFYIEINKKCLGLFWFFCCSLVTDNKHVFIFPFLVGDGADWVWLFLSGS